MVTIVSITFFAICQSCTDGKQKEVGSKSTDSELVVATAITITPDVPLDVSDPSNLADAANFAWNEFIALTWPAQAQGPVDYPRGKPQLIGKYGDKGPTGQVVWETYRHRVEVYPAQGNPNGYDPGKPDYGYSSKPAYIYSEPIPPLNPSAPKKDPPFINLDEVTQITLNQMYSGAYGHHTGNANSVTRNQQILFLAKVNESYYKYVAKNKFFDSSEKRVQDILQNSGGYAVTGDATKYPPPYTDLPSSDPKTGSEGAIEIKSAWRRLNPDKEDISTFYTSTVRYYEGNETTQKIAGYVDSDNPSINEIWGLIGLHIIHKTPNAPSFVYASFSHFNNILDAEGQSVEDADGTTYPKYLAEAPFTPALEIIGAPVDTLGYQKVFTVSGKVNTNSPQLYFHNTKGAEAIQIGEASGPTYKDAVVLNRRLYPIPPVIVNANKTAHNLIAAANPNSVWRNYKLINVQAEPLDYVRDSSRIDNELGATYYLSNEVIESNPSLQKFSGAINFPALSLPQSGNAYNFGFKLFGPSPGYKNNVFLRKSSPPKIYNMGGCMGCHGAQGQKKGGDFSVLLAKGRIFEPDFIQLDVKNDEHVEYLMEKYLLALKADE